MFRSPWQAHFLERDADGARGDDDDFTTIFAKGGSGFDDQGEGGEERLVGLFVDDGGCACEVLAGLDAGVCRYF